MANTAASQQALAHDPRFIARVRGALGNVAWQIIEENSGTAHHAERVAYARSVLANLDVVATGIAVWLVERPNVLNFETSYDFDTLTVVTTSGDADIKSQLSSDWNVLAGVA